MISQQARSKATGEQYFMFIFAELSLFTKALSSFMILKNLEKFKYILLLISTFNNKVYFKVIWRQKTFKLAKQKVYLQSPLLCNIGTSAFSSRHSQIHWIFRRNKDHQTNVAE
jgi:hypothetical protein